MNLVELFMLIFDSTLNFFYAFNFLIPLSVKKQGLYNFLKVYERSIEYFNENLSDTLLIAFAQFEERQKEHDRARVIYRYHIRFICAVRKASVQVLNVFGDFEYFRRYGLDHLPANRSAEIFKFYTIHEKKFGEKAGIEKVIVSKRRHQYEKVIFHYW